MTHVIRTRVVDDPMVGEARALTLCETHSFGVMTTISEPMIAKRKGAAILLNGKVLLAMEQECRLACIEEGGKRGKSEGEVG